MPEKENQITPLYQNTRNCIAVITLLVCCSLSSFSGNAQCTYNVSTPIPDDDILTIDLAVTGLIDGILSSPTQGICGVEIDFMHEYLGDLTISLVSPAGTIVQLIGPPTTAITPTNLSRWNIDFVQCLAPASPDAGFSDVWSNDQAWQALATYTGTYHPSSGCLENFNVGPANGVWQLIIEDHDQFQIGSIAEITLVFCNPMGLMCAECLPNAGSLSPLSFDICSGQNIQSSDITIDFGGNPPVATDYAYEYLLLSGNTILQSGSSFSITPPVGMYTICGMSYLINDTLAINALLASDDYSMLSQAVSNGFVCGDLTTSCVSINVRNKPDTVFVSGTICNGEVFSYGGQDYFSDGVFYQVHDGPGLCDTIVEINIFARSLSVMVPVPDTLFCGSASVDLQASASGSAGPFTFSWSTVNGNITSAPNLANVTVNQSGQYFVTVSDGICEGTGSVNVIPGPGFPQVVFSGGTITCSRSSISITPIYTPTTGTILWMGPMGFSSSQPNITATIPGTYTLQVTNQSGCTTARSVDIGIDTTTIPVDIIVIGKDCQNQALTLGNLFPERFVAWWWTGPNTFTSNYWRPVVTDPGIYTMTGTFPNGCTRSGTFTFDGDFSIPDIILSPEDTLNCNEVITLNVSSSTPGVNVTWNGPQGFYSTQPSIQIDQEGNYLAAVISPNGCGTSDTVKVVKGDDVFDFQIVTDTLTCAKTSVLIGVIAPDADLFQWLNYSGPDGDQSMIQVGVGGNYTVRMTDTTSGCVVTAIVFVPSDFNVPSFGYTTDTITCADPIAELNFVPLAGYTYSSVHWELPDMTVVQGPTLMSGLPGEHRLVGTSPNGCTGVWRIHIPFDTLTPFLILESDTLICRDTTTIIAQSLDSIVSFQWSGPGIVDLMGLNARVSLPGWYNLSAAGPNGCPSSYDVFVDSNYIKPDFMIVADSLRCDRDATLAIVPLDDILSVAWYDPLLQVISIDTFVQVNTPGSYTVILEGTNQCTADDVITLEALIFPVVTLSTDTFSCDALTAGINAQVDILQYAIAWLDMNGDTFDINTMISVTDGGPFVSSVTGPNACTTRDTISVPYDTLSPAAVIEMIGQVRCQNRDVTLDGSSSVPDPLLYTWSTVDGNILSQPTQVMIDVRDTGLYTLIVEQPSNGCRDTANFQVTEHPDAITNVNVLISDPACSGDNNASINIVDVVGGIEPFLYQINSGSLQSNPGFVDLSAGDYILSIIDAENCVFDTLVSVDSTGVFTVDAGPDIEIYLGEAASLSGMTDLADDLILNDQWDSLGLTLCFDCALFDVTPFETSTYTYQVISLTGCVLTDEVIVYVIEKGKYYIGNVFTPNGDGINDEIRINSAGGIEKVVEWIIFDRWGNAVFGETDFNPDDPQVFWNGRTSTGEFPNPGVFPYVLELQLINGRTEVHHGEITLIR